MRLQDIIHETEEEELAAISQFFKGRAEDEGVPGHLSVDAFANIANKLGISIDGKRLQQMVQSGQIGNIADVNDDEIKFDPEDETVGKEMMGQDKAKMVVSQAAKRAAAKRSK